MISHLTLSPDREIPWPQGSLGEVSTSLYKLDLMLSCVVSMSYDPLLLWQAYTTLWSGFRPALTFVTYLWKPTGPHGTRVLPAHQVMIWPYSYSGHQPEQPSASSELPYFRAILKDNTAETLLSSKIRHFLTSILDVHKAFKLQHTSEFEPLPLKLTQLTFQLVGSKAQGTLSSQMWQHTKLVHYQAEIYHSYLRGYNNNHTFILRLSISL